MAHALLLQAGVRRLAAFAVSCACCAVLAPAEVAAQRTGRVAVGANASVKRALADESHGHDGVGFLWRLGRGREGWGWKYGINWYSTEIDRAIEGERRPFGRLRIRPLLGGYGYTHVVGPAKISANMMAGYAFNSVSLLDSFDGAYRAARSVESIDAGASNTWVLKPEISAWIDLGDKLGLNLSGAYLIARPEVSIRSSAGRDRQTVNADTLSIKAGLVYAIF